MFAHFQSLSRIFFNFIIVQQIFLSTHFIQLTFLASYNLKRISPFKFPDYKPALSLLIFQSAFTCSKAIIETLKQADKSILSTLEAATLYITLNITCSTGRYPPATFLFIAYQQLYPGTLDALFYKQRFFSTQLKGTLMQI